MPYHFGDVIFVPFPFTDQSTTKRRPAVVVSSDAYHRDRPDIILMAVTSQMRPAPTPACSSLRSSSPYSHRSLTDHRSLTHRSLTDGS